MQSDMQKIIEKQFSKLPKVVQNAITSGHVGEKFKELANKHRLHLDQWQQVEDLIMFTILGLSSPADLPSKIAEESGLSIERADELVEDIANTVFQPIREELERELGAPQAKEEGIDDIEKLRRGALEEEKGLGSSGQVSEQTPLASLQPETSPLKPVTSPGTPPPPPPSEKIARAPASGAYLPGQTSAARANVVDDPYREAP